MIHNTKYTNRPMSFPRERLPEDDRKKVAVCGIANLHASNYLWLCKTLDRLVFAMDDPIILVRGTADARCNLTDLMVVNWASWNWYTTRLYYADLNRRQPARKAVQKRDQKMMSEADYLAAFWDGECQETESLVKSANEAGVKVKVIRV